MRTLRTFFVATALVSTVALTTTHSANSGEKRCRVISTCNQPTTATSTPIANQSVMPVQTCCQPTAASVQPKIELIAYARPASPRRLTPQPDALEINQTSADMACAQFIAMDYGTYQVYYGLLCSDQSPVPIYGSDLGPLPGDCGNPNGACVIFNASIIPTAFNNKSSSSNSSMIQKGVQLTHKLKVGQECPNRADALATGAHKLKERTRVGEPTYIKFAGSAGESVTVELQKYFVKGTGKSSQELSGTFAIGIEVDAAPVGVKVKEVDRQQIQVVADHVARLTIGNVTYDIVTASKLTQ